MSKTDILKWNSKRIDVMAQINMYKFGTHQDLRELLIDTDGLLLIEANYWGDVFWGRYKSKGSNNLGIILMKIRTFWVGMSFL